MTITSSPITNKVPFIIIRVLMGRNPRKNAKLRYYFEFFYKTFYWAAGVVFLIRVWKNGPALPTQ